MTNLQRLIEAAKNLDHTPHVGGGMKYLVTGSAKVDCFLMVKADSPEAAILQAEAIPWDEWMTLEPDNSPEITGTEERA